MTEQPPPSSAVAVWERLLSDIGRDYPPSFMLFSPAYSLLSDAIRAYDAEAIQAACAMARASAEAACYTFLTRRKESLPGEPRSVRWNIEVPTTLGGKPREIGFEELIDAIRERNVLSLEDLKAIRRIKNDGNFAVHAASRQDRVLHRLMQTREQFLKETSRDRLLRPMRIWVSKEEAFSDIADAGRILGKLVKSAGPWARFETAPAKA